MSIEAPFLISNFPSEDLSFEKISDLSKEFHFQEKLQDAKLVADLGSGFGNSTVALRELVPNAQMHSVDSYYSRILEEHSQVLGENHFHFFETIHDYLARFNGEGRKLDVVLLKAVPEHQLEKEGGYTLLSGAMTEDGLVISIGDTELDYGSMKDNFTPLFERDYRFRYGVYVWQKK